MKTNRPIHDSRHDFKMLFSGFLALVVLCLLVLLLWPRPRGSRADAFSFSIYRLYSLLMAFPLLGLAVCLLIAGVFHHADTTKTHCGVYNFWPSISAAIGNNNPERFIWRLAVGLHNAFTVFDALLVYDRLVRLSGRVVLSRLCAFCKAMSSLSLFVLTFVASGEVYSVHKLGFVSWVIFGSLSLTLFLWIWRSAVTPTTAEEQFVWTWLRVTASGYFGFLLVAGFFFYIHNAFCLPLAYSFFGICEFMVIISYVFGVGLGPIVAFYGKRSEVVLMSTGMSGL